VVSALLSLVIFFSAGAFISTLGSLTGLGGGFLCVPFLVVAWGLGREDAVLLSLTMILANSTSASVSYIRSGLVDFRVALLLIITALPGLVLGYLLLRSMEAAQFDILFAILLITVNVYILVSRTRKGSGSGADGEKGSSNRDTGGWSRRKLSPAISMPVAFLAGVASSTFGIGGGAVLMPLQVGLLKIKVKRAIATSMFLLMLMSAFRVLVISRADFDPIIGLPLALGAIFGAQAGSLLVRRVKARYLLFILSGFLFLIAFYMAGSALNELL